MSCLATNSQPRQRASRHALWGLALLLPGCLLLTGCYDTERLLRHARHKAIQSRLEEVSLGYFRTTLSRERLDTSHLEIELELYATTVHYRVPDLKKALHSNKHRLRQAILIAIRQSNPAELFEPNLDSLRTRLQKVILAEIPEPPIEAIGLQQVRFIPQ